MPDRGEKYVVLFIFLFILFIGVFFVFPSIYVKLAAFALLGLFSLFIPYRAILPLLVIYMTGVPVETALDNFALFGFDVSFHEILFGLLLAVWFLELVSGRVQSSFRSREAILISITVLYLLVPIFVGLSKPHLGFAWRNDIRHSFFYLAYFPIVTYISDLKDAERAYKWLALGMLGFSLLIISPFVIGHLSPLYSYLHGTIRFGQRNNNIMLITYPFLFQLYVLDSKPFFKNEGKVARAVIFTILLLGLLLTQTRTMWLGVLGTVLLLLIFNISEKRSTAVLVTVGKVVLILVVMVVLLNAGLYLLARDLYDYISYFLTERFATLGRIGTDLALAIRKIERMDARAMWRDNIWIGRGFGTSWAIMGEEYSFCDDFYWTTLAKTGIIGLSLLLSVYLYYSYILFRLFRIRKRLKTLFARRFVEVQFATIPATFAMGYVNSHLFDSPITIVGYLVLIAITEYLYDRAIVHKDPECLKELPC
ncbi:hypothetical protein J7K18_07675 [bacterium]|nr:hypothetical protein [bacterium]